MRIVLRHYDGNDFSVARTGESWTLWRFVDDGTDIERFILSTEAMDELRDYFAEVYPEERNER